MTWCTIILLLEESMVFALDHRNMELRTLILTWLLQIWSFAKYNWLHFVMNVITSSLMTPDICKWLYYTELMDLNAISVESMYKSVSTLLCEYIIFLTNDLWDWPEFTKPKQIGPREKICYWISKDRNQTKYILSFLHTNCKVM